jgi:hypothetical protein
MAALGDAASSTPSHELIATTTAAGPFGETSVLPRLNPDAVAAFAAQRSSDAR